MLSKTLNQLISEIVKANKEQTTEAQLASLSQPVTGPKDTAGRSSLNLRNNLYQGLSRAFNTKSGSPRYTIHPLAGRKTRVSYPAADDKNPQTYNWSPVTTMEAGLAIPYIYGTMKAKGNVIAGHLGGSNSIDSQMSVTTLIALCKGPIEQFVSAEINGSPIVINSRYEPMDWSVTKVAGFDFRGGWNSQQFITPWQQVYENLPVDSDPPGNNKVLYGTPLLITVDMTDRDDCWVYLKFPTGLYTQLDDSKDVANEACHVKVEMRKSPSVLFQTVFDQDIVCNMRVPYRYYIRAFETQYGIYYDPLSEDSYKIRISKTTIDKYSGGVGTITIAVGGSGYAPGDLIRVLGNTPGSIDAILEVATVDSGVITSINIVNTGTGYSVSEIQGTTTITGGGSSATVNIPTLCTSVNDLEIEYVTTGTRDDISYNGMALVALWGIASEKLSGSLDFSCVIKGRQVSVYTGVSTYTLQWSDNPAWVCFDILTQPIWSNTYSWDGLKYEPSNWVLRRWDGIQPSDIDIQSFIDWAEHCDEEVTPPDYDPLDVKRCTFNGIFDTVTNIWDAATSVADNARAWLLPPSGTAKYRVVLDKPYVNLGGPSVTQLFNTGNIIKDSLEQIYTSMIDRATELQVEFINKDLNWESDTFSARYLFATVPREDSINLHGITVASQAWRRAMLQLYYNAVTPLEAQWDVGQDALNCQVGDVVGLQHELPQYGFGGRVVSATGSVVVLDRPVEIITSTDYVMTVRNNDDTLTNFNILYANNPATGGTCTLYGTFSPVPAKYDPFAFGEPALTYKPFRVLEIKNNGDNTFHISGQEYNDSVYNVDTDTPPVPTPDYSALNPFPVVTNLACDEVVITLPDGTINDCVDVHFTRPSSSLYGKAHIYYQSKRLIGDSYPVRWQDGGVTNSEVYRLQNLMTFYYYKIAVVTINTTGKGGPVDLAPYIEFRPLGKSIPPADVLNFKVFQYGLTLIFTWDHVPDLDLWGYEIRVGDTFANSIEILDVQSANRYDYPAPVGGTYTYWIRAKDTSGLYSTNPASVTINVVNVNGRLDYLWDLDLIKTYDDTGQIVWDWSWVDVGHFFTWSPASGCAGTPPPYWADYTTDGCLLATFESKNVEIADSSAACIIQLTQETSIWDDTDPTDQTYPTRTDQTYPRDTDQHLTINPTPTGYTTRIFYACGDTLDPTNWTEYVYPIKAAIRYLKVRSIAYVDNFSREVPFSITSLRCMVDLQDFEFDIPGFEITHYEGEDILYATYGYMMTCSNPNITATVSYGAYGSNPVSVVPYISQITTTGFHIELKDIVGTGRLGMVNIHVHGF